ncbi:4476_t:CDS:2 [Paraglomus occultum]|uniref:4476_t:CDS:1 n=1 Tax=Paraglomus occultum TaxID=144539 RepID=A0A9N9FQE0_9GLOM|nr:4476_t:CDS:2 [Paraglomus occultum]
MSAILQPSKESIMKFIVKHKQNTAVCLFDLKQEFGDTCVQSLENLVGETILTERKRRVGSINTCDSFGKSSEDTLTIYYLGEKANNYVHYGHVIGNSCTEHKGVKRKSLPESDITSIESDPKALTEKLNSKRFNQHTRLNRFMQRQTLLQSQIKSLEERLNALKADETEIMKQFEETDIQKILDAHYKRIHEYNEIKDVGQMLFGKCAEIEGTTTREMYEKFGVGIED